MRIAIVTHSSTYESRAEAAGVCFAQRGDRVTWIYSDYNHLTKQTQKREAAAHVFMHMRPYRKNLSAKRLFSISRFAVDVCRYIDRQMQGEDPFDLLYFMIPANTFVREAAKLKRRYGVKIIFDLIDLWPESLPLDVVKKTPPVRYWRKLRDRNFACADLIFIECRLYREILHPDPKLAEKMETLYWFRDFERRPEKKTGKKRAGKSLPDKDAAGRTEKPDTDGDGRTLQIAYMGAINNIIDIPAITELLLAIDRVRPVKLHIIGEGNHAADFVQAVQSAGISVKDYGPVYDEKEKEEILACCSFGLNIMKPGVRVGLTMKSIEYLGHGLPLLNNIQGDTAELVEKFGIGVNVPFGTAKRKTAGSRAGKAEKKALAACVRAVSAMADDPGAGVRAENAYQNFFTGKSFEKSFEEAMKAHGIWTSEISL